MSYKCLKLRDGRVYWCLLSIPYEHIRVYDEAQRAWDAERVNEKRGHATSEPEDFLKLAERMDSWALMVALIGEGQEIHPGRAT